MNKALIVLTAFGLMGVTAATASAYGGFGPGSLGERSSKGERPGYVEMMAQKAELLGVSVEDLEAARAEGASFRDLAEELGVTEEEMHERMLVRAAERLQEQVEAGDMTEAEAEEFLERMEERQGSCAGPHITGERRGGFGKGGPRFKSLNR